MAVLMSIAFALPVYYICDLHGSFFLVWLVWLVSLADGIGAPRRRPSRAHAAQQPGRAASGCPPPVGERVSEKKTPKVGWACAQRSRMRPRRCRRRWTSPTRCCSRCRPRCCLRPATCCAGATSRGTGSGSATSTGAPCLPARALPRSQPGCRPCSRRALHWPPCGAPVGADRQAARPCSRADRAAGACAPRRRRAAPTCSIWRGGAS